MLRIEPQPFTEMKAHAEATYPNECVGAMVGTIANGTKVVESALKLENSALLALIVIAIAIPASAKTRAMSCTVQCVRNDQPNPRRSRSTPSGL